MRFAVRPLSKSDIVWKGTENSCCSFDGKNSPAFEKVFAGISCGDCYRFASVFYSVMHGEKHPLTSRMAQYILQKYGEQARETCQEIPEKVHPHLFRHSRAMHLYQEGMDLTLVSQWLGHSQLETTQIYAHADTEHKRKAIAAATPRDNPLYSKLNSTRYTVNDDEILKKLTGLR